MSRIWTLIFTLIAGAIFAPPAIAQYNPFNPDFAFCNTRGALATRKATAWNCLTPGTAGQVMVSNGPGADVGWLTLAGTGTVTSVNASGGTTGLTFSGGPITTSGTFTLNGTLAIANGGTGATSAGAALTALGAVPLAGGAMTGNLSISASGTNLTLNNTGAASPTAITGVGLQITSGAGTDVEINAVASNPELMGRRINGSVASPTQSVVNNQLFGIGATGVATTTLATAPRAYFGMYAAENWTGSAQGTFASIWTTPIGSITMTERLKIFDTGAVTPGVASTQTLGSPGLQWSTIYGQNGIFSNGVSIANSLNITGGGLTVTGTTVLNTALASAYGGTGQSSYATGDLLVGSGSSLAKLGIGTNGYVLTVQSGTASWQPPQVVTNTAPKTTLYTAGNSGTWSRTGAPLYIDVEVAGGGGGGSGIMQTSCVAGNNPTNGGNGGNSSFGSITANGGSGGISNNTTIPTFASASGGDTNFPGQPNRVTDIVGAGATFTDYLVAAGMGGTYGGAAGYNTSPRCFASNGGSGGYARARIYSPAASYSFAAGAAGTAGSNGAACSGACVAPTAGGGGYVRVIEYYQ